VACYIVSYDLVKQRDYTSLIAEIKKYGTWAHIHESVWAVVTEMSAVEVREDLKRHMDSDDRIFVVRSGTEAAWRGVLCSADWLHKNL
jgi:hypothetical protein